MRILYHHRTRAEDGQAVHIRSLMEAFRAEGHELAEVALVPRSAGSSGNGGSGGGEPDRRPPWGWVARAPRFARELAEYAYTWPARGRLVRAGRAFAPDFLYERYAFGNGAGVGAAERLGLPIVVEVNSPMALELGHTRGLAFPRLAARVEASILRRATRVCAVSGVLAEMLVEMGVERERLILTPNGVHPEHYRDGDGNPWDPAAARASLGLAEVSGPLLGFVGYPRDWHRLERVVKGLRRPDMAHVHLVLVGPGPADAGLRAAAQGLGVSARVHFESPRPHAEVPRFLAAFDVALLPAINPYASPLKLVEYMAAARAVVAPDQPNLREVLTHGENALLVPPDDPDALLGAIARLVGDPDLRARLGAAAARTVAERDLTWRANAARVVAAVGELRGGTG